MADLNAEFDTRIHKLVLKHQNMARGVVTSVNHDGLIIAKPRRRGLRIPVQGPALFIGMFVFFKAFLLATIGPVGYADRVDMLAQGTVVEQFGAMVMQIEPATEFVAQSLGPILR